MRITLTILITIFTLNTINSQNGIELKLNDTWFSGELKINENPVIIRGRSHLKNFLESEKYDEIIQITWEMESPTKNGIPTTQENKYMGKIEDALIKSIETDLQSVLAFIQTHENKRTWFFYSKSVEVFMERINETLSEFKKIPISIEFLDDAEWIAYKTMLSDFKMELK